MENAVRRAWRSTAWRVAGQWSLLLAAVVLLPAAWILGPQVALWWHLRSAREAIHARRYDRAMEELRQTLRLDADSVEAHFLLARLHRRLRHLDEAPDWLRRAVQLGGDAQRAERETWLILAQSGRIREAEPHLASLLLDPREDGADICEAYVLGYLTNLRVAEARRLLDTWQNADPNDAQPLFTRAYLEHGLGRKPEAIDAYRRGLAMSPDETLMRSRLAAVLLETGELEEASQHLLQCLHESPHDSEVLFNWATCQFRRNHPDEARETLQQLLEESPNHFDARRLLGEVELAAGRFEEARHHLELAARQRPYDCTVRNALGKALRALGRATEAKPHFDYVAQAEGPLSRLEKQLRLVVERPDDIGLRLQIGTTLLEYGSPEDGVKWLRTVLELQPAHRGAHEALAGYYETVGDWPNAAQHRRLAAGRLAAEGK